MSSYPPLTLPIFLGDILCKHAAYQAHELWVPILLTKEEGVIRILHTLPPLWVRAMHLEDTLERLLPQLTVYYRTSSWKEDEAEGLVRVYLFLPKDIQCLKEYIALETVESEVSWSEGSYPYYSHTLLISSKGRYWKLKGEDGSLLPYRPQGQIIVLSRLDAV